MTTPILTWIVYDHGKIGTLNQCLGLAEALNLQAVIKPVKARFPWCYLPPSTWFAPLRGLTLATRLQSPWPDLIISAGRVSAAPCAEIRRLTQGRTRVIQLLNPHMNPKKFDAVVVPHHDGLQGDNVITTLGPLHRITTERLHNEYQKFSSVLQPLHHPSIAVLIGGSNKHFTISESVIDQLTHQLQHLAHDHNASLMITVSRRTPFHCIRRLHQQLKGLSVHFWDSKGYNPYFAYLAHADAILVTCDSISMIAEAAATGKPVYMINLPGHSRKFQKFYDEMQRLNHMRVFDGSLKPFKYQKLDDVAGVIERLKFLELIKIKL